MHILCPTNHIDHRSIEEKKGYGNKLINIDIELNSALFLLKKEN